MKLESFGIIAPDDNLALLTFRQKDLGLMTAEEVSYAMAEIRQMRGFPLPFPYPPEPLLLQQYKSAVGSREWCKMREADRSEHQQEVFSNPEVMKYMEKRQQVMCENLSNVGVLEEDMRLWYNMKDMDRLRVCWEAYVEYPPTIDLPGKAILWRRREMKEILNV